MTVVTGLAVAFGLIYHLVRPEELVYEATATVVIQETAVSVETATPQNANTQFIRSQLEIIGSPVVTEAAAGIAARSGVEIEPDSLASSVSIVGTPDSPLVTLTAQAATPEAAVVVANAVAEGYREVSQRQASATAETQLARIDAQVTAIDERLNEIDSELSAVVSEAPGLSTLEEQARQATSEIASLQEQLLASAPEERADIRARIEDHRQAITVYREVLEASSGGPEEAALLQEQALQIDRRAQLLTLRDEVAVDAGLAPDAIALVQSAVAAEPISGMGLARVLAVSLLLGLVLGVGGAYFLTTFRRVITARDEPESILGAPLLADVPDFEWENLTSQLPIRDHPRSAAAEAFRFAAASAEVALRGRECKSIFVMSSTVGHGKTTTVVNMAIASAIHGRSVLLIDCDFGNQQASRMLLGDDHAGLTGLTDVVEGVAGRLEAVHPLDLGGGVSLSLMPRGTSRSPAAATLQSLGSAELFQAVSDNFDMVFIDGPPLLQVAYASTLAELAETLIVIVEHQGSHSELVDLRNRLSLIGTPLIGYVYNRSPLRREMAMSEGSMMDILGNAGFDPEVPAVKPLKRRA